MTPALRSVAATRVTSPLAIHSTEPRGGSGGRATASALIVVVIALDVATGKNLRTGY